MTLCSLKEIDNAVKETEKFLDTIDISKYLRNGKDLYDVIDEIEDDYGEQVENNPLFQGYVFNWMAPDEFGDYLEKRFNIRINEEVNINYRIGGWTDGVNQ